jgi:hypothetical protein
MGQKGNELLLAQRALVGRARNQQVDIGTMGCIYRQFSSHCQHILLSIMCSSLMMERHCGKALTEAMLPEGTNVIIGGMINGVICFYVPSVG